MKNFLSFFLLLSLCCSSCMDAQTVSAEVFEKGLAGKNIQLLDVRTPDEFNEAHISHAMLANIQDEAEFNRRIAALDKAQPVYVYCLGGGRSHQAVGILKKQGFKEVVELGGGVNAWRNAGKKLEGVTEAPQLSEDEYDHLVKSAPVVLVDFGAEWCPPCRKMAPIITELEKSYEGRATVVKIDGGKQFELMSGKNIKAMPGFILYKDGEEVWRATGVVEREEMEKQLSTALGE